MYFLQILDKSAVGYGAAFGMREQTHLVGNQYSLISSSGYWAQLALCAGPTAALIVKVPTRILMSACIFCWGVSMIGLAFSKSFGPLLCNRFLLGLFEAVNIPLFTVITTTWYRRHEQPLRIALWYGTNGVASMLGSLLTWALSFITTGPLYVYQILFLFVGLVTVLTAPLLYWRLDNNPATARFLTPMERKMAVERLRDNNTGVENKTIRWDQVREVFLSIPVWFYFLLIFCINTVAAVTNTFGPLLIKGFGFNARQTILLNIPFGFVQTAVCLGGCYLATRFRYKGIVFIAFMVPCVIGAALLYALTPEQARGAMLAGYYLIGFLFGGNPLMFSWVAANVAGHTKKSLTISLCNSGLAVGNIVGPFLFQEKDAPRYHPGLGGVLGLFVASMGLTVGLWGVLLVMNKRKEAERVAHGKPAKIHNSSLNAKFSQADETQVDANGNPLGQQAFLDLTDQQNDEFVYTY